VKIKSIRTTIVSACILVLLLSQRHLGFILLLLALPFFPWLLYSTYVIVAKPDRRAVQASKIAIWVVAASMIVGIHVYRHTSTREQANQMVNAIRKYTAEHGHCPADLAAVGVSPAQIKSRLGYAWYRCEAGEISFSYPSVQVPFEMESYDFKSGTWKHIND
jgi:hypothetical protein